MSDVSMKKRIWGWMAFDWATQPFYTLGLTFVFSPYFAEIASAWFLSEGMTETAADASAQSLWFWGQTIAGLLIAFTAPIIGAYADSTGRRMPWIIAFSVIMASVSWTLWFTFPDASTIYLMLIAFNLAFIAAEFCLIFTNAILPSLGTHKEIGRISGDGAAYGYLGGVVAFLIVFAMLIEGDDGRTLVGLSPIFGLDPVEREGTRSIGIFISLWFVIFMIPFFMWVREPAEPNRAGGLRKALVDLGSTLKGTLKRRSLFNFLMSSMLYRDALNALYAAGGIYAVLVLDWELMQLGVFGVISIITAFVATLIGGRFDSRLGPKPVIRFCCYCLIFVCVIIVGMSRESFLGMISFAEGSTIPDIIFYICGSVIGGAGGAIYAASRSMMVRHTTPNRPTEAFGLFALSGKATAFLAPMLIAIFTALTGSAQYGYLPVILLFLGGLYLLNFVLPEGDIEEWSKDAVPAP
ncbi:MAG: MFS transporter [Pseudomonadota bacterium]